MLGLPLLLLLLVETVLRLVGYGYPTAFLLPDDRGHESFWIENRQFGWRYFTPTQARAPDPFAFPHEKPDGTTRIFVLGESAAMGDPQPAFGLAPMLQALLSARYPDRRFEVINAAITAINSHAVRDIAGDCARADGDLWVIYMGNNEVVGPFGSGTVFGDQTPPLWMIRSSLTLKQTRTGQLLDAFKTRLHATGNPAEDWMGMQMFLGHQVRADDPRMNRVYHHFEQNLTDIIQAGRRAGAGVVLCNVAVNLADCAPFASLTQDELSSSRNARWDEPYQRGTELHRQGQHEQALAAFETALSAGGNLAEIHFGMGRCLLELGDAARAKEALRKARDLDTLRFRSDSRMEEIVERVAADRANDPQVRFADVVTAFASASPSGIPGKELFHEHVHLTWEGNYLLARTVAEQIEPLLTGREANAPPAGAAWPSSEECARRLAWTPRRQLEGVAEIRQRVSDPPFTLQLNHADQIEYLDRLGQRLVAESRNQPLTEERAILEEATRLAPDNPALQHQLANVCLDVGDTEAALEAARAFTRLLPHTALSWHQYGLTLVKLDRMEEALRQFETARKLAPEDVSILNNLAMAHVRLGHPERALREWQEALERRPHFGTAYLGIGQLLEQQGKTAEAEVAYRKALQNRILRPEDLGALGQLCLRKGWYDDAIKNLTDAIRLAPGDASLHTALAQALQAVDRKEEARQHLAKAAELNPDPLQHHYRLGLSLGRAGKPAEAAEHFREVVRLKPDLVEGRLNLGIALSSVGSTNEALEQLNEVLRLDPTNATARRYINELTPTAPKAE